MSVVTGALALPRDAAREDATRGETERGRPDSAFSVSTRHYTGVTLTVTRCVYTVRIFYIHRLYRESNILLTVLAHTARLPRLSKRANAERKGFRAPQTTSIPYDQGVPRASRAQLVC